jgi:hypothetical protein
MTRCLLLLACALLAACGRVGPPHPPGPRDQVIYPRGYPAADPPEGAVRSRPPLSF